MYYDRIASILTSLFICMIIFGLQAKERKKYLLITEPQYKETARMKEFIEFRNTMYNVTVKTVKEAGSDASGIKSFIKTMYYDKGGLSYVLFVGKAGVIPFEKKRYPTYQSYGDMGGDTKMEIAVGCFFVRSSTDLDNIIRKTIHTEKNINRYPKVHIQFSTFSGDAHIENECGVMRDRYWEKPTNDETTYKTSWMIPRSGESNSKYVHDLYSFINGNKATFIAYQGHGLETAWADGNARITNRDVGKLTNTVVYPVIMSNACLTGSFQNSSKCFGEVWMTSKNGAVAFYGATNVSYSYQKMFNAGWACGVAQHPQIHTIGDLFVYSKAFCLDSTINSSGFRIDKSHETMYNLFGDPGLEFRKYTTPVVPDQIALSTVEKTIGINAMNKNTITLTNNPTGQYQIDVFTLTGKIIARINKAFAQTGKHFVSLSPCLSNGVYIINIEGQGISASKKVSFTR